MIFVSWLHDVEPPSPVELLLRSRAYGRGPVPALSFPYLYDPQPNGYPKPSIDKSGPRKGQPACKHIRDVDGRTHKIPVQIRRAHPTRRRYLDLSYRQAA